MKKMRDRTVKLRISEDELELIRERAEHAGIKSLSEYLRFSAQNLYVNPAISDRITRGISRWSANLNQLAHHCNFSGTPPEAAAIAALRAEAVEILKMLQLARRQ